MKKISKKTIIAIVIALVVVAAVATTLALTLGGGGKVGSLSSEKYETVGIDFVQMTQKATHTYDLEITLNESVDTSDINIYWSKYDTFSVENSEKLVYKDENGKYVIEGVTYDAGDYFIYVTSGDETGTYPITVPKMNPKTWMNGEIVNIEMEVDGNTSWSSFIDPEGKNVYRSSSLTFDDKAVALEENIDILTSSYSDPGANKEQPYYYLVFNGKNGTFKYISTPLFYTGTQGEASVEFYEKDNKPYLKLTGTLYATDKEAERTMQLRVGNFDGDDPTSTFIVNNTYKGGDKTAFEFNVPLEELKAASNNLVIFLTENGTMTEWSISTEDLDLTKYSLESGNAAYGLTDNSALKITRFVNAYDGISVKLGTSGKKAVLKVTGTLKYGIGGSDYQLIVASPDGQQYVAENKVETGKDFDFEFPLEQLYSSGVWYDVQIKCVDEIQYYDVLTSAANMNENVVVGEKKYDFQEYGGLLKVQYTIVKNFSGLKASMYTKDGKPMLSVTGEIKNTTAADLSLAIRTGDTVVTSKNTEKTDGKFSAVLDLSQMKKSDEWYDVLIHYAGDDAYYDLSTNNADMKQTTNANGYVYSFKDWEEQLKVMFADEPVTVNNAKAVVEKQNGKAVLIVTGTTNEDASTYKLGIRNGDNLFATVANTASGKNLKFTFDLSKLTGIGDWYDIIIGHEGFSDSTDLTTANANMDTNFTFGKRIYKFADWEGQLKVYFNKVLSDIKGVKAQITTKKGKALLIVTGTMNNAANKYLALRTEDKIMKVSNKGKGNNLNFTFDLSKLSSVDTWYDVIIGTNGSAEYSDLTVAAADMSQSVTTSKRVYKFQEWERALKVSYSAVVKDLKNIKSTITTKSGKPVLIITGTMNGAADKYLGLRTGDTIYKVKNKGTGNKLNFTFDLSKLAKAGTWYDVIIGNKDFSSYKDVTVNTADTSKNTVYKNKVYKFADYENALKVYFESDTAAGLAKGQAISNVKAILLLKNGKPVLRVQGTMKGIKNINILLGIRTEDKTTKIANATSTENRFIFDFDLTKLSKSGTWYDIVLIEKESGAYIDVTTKSVYNMDMTITYKDNVYRFADWEGDLKAYYTNTAEEEAAKAEIANNIKNVSTKISLENGKPILSVTADIGSIKNGNIALGIRSGETIILEKNTTNSSGKFTCKFDMTKLTSKSTWYDVYWNIESEGMTIDLKQSDADMESKALYNGFTYQFKEWNSQLKVEYE